MPYTRNTKRGGTIRLVIDRASLTIYVLCLILALVLAFAAGYLGGISRSAATRPASSNTSGWQDALQPNDPSPGDTLSPPPQDLERPRRTAAARNRTPYEKDTTRDTTRIRVVFREGRTPTRRRNPSLVPAARPDEPDSLPVGMPDEEYGYTVQLGAFSDNESADSLMERVRTLGYEPEQVYTWHQPGQPVYCVWIGHYDDPDKAEAAAARYRALEGGDARVVQRIISAINN